MDKLNFIYPEIFISLSIMFLLILGVFKKNSENLVYNLSTITLIVLLALVVNLFSINETLIFNESYKIDNLSSFMKSITIVSAIFVMLSSSTYLKALKILKIEYPILILSSILINYLKLQNNNLMPWVKHSTIVS